MSILLLAGALCGSVFYDARAQPNPGGDPDEVPISGIGLLLAAGAAYGAKKAYNVYRKGKQ